MELVYKHVAMSEHFPATRPHSPENKDLDNKSKNGESPCGLC